MQYKIDFKCCIRNIGNLLKHLLFWLNMFDIFCFVDLYEAAQHNACIDEISI